MLARFEVFFRFDKKDWTFRLKAPNNEILAIGIGYKSKKECIDAIELFKRVAPNARIEEKSGKK